MIERITPQPGQESVWDYPRPPALEPVDREIVVEFGGVEIARTTAEDPAYRVLETSHPPVYYLPPAAFGPGTLRPAGGGSFCEWKGQAAYFDLVVPADRAADGVEHLAAAKAWSYPDPTDRFAAIRDHVALYAHAVDRCTVGGVEVTPQPGGFYGGWITPDVVGPFKGGPGTWGW